MKVGGARTPLIGIVALAMLVSVCAFALIAWRGSSPTSVTGPNPPKVSWLSLSLHEKLVYYDPWYAGTGLPIVVMVSLVAIPAAIGVFAVCCAPTRRNRRQRLDSSVSEG